MQEFVFYCSTDGGLSVFKIKIWKAWQVHWNQDTIRECLINRLNAELNPICHLLALVGARHIVHVSRIRVNAVALEWNINPHRGLLNLMLLWWARFVMKTFLDMNCLPIGIAGLTGLCLLKGCVPIYVGLLRPPSYAAIVFSLEWHMNEYRGLAAWEWQEKRKYSKKNLSRFRFLHQKSYTDGSGTGARNFLP